MQPRQAASVDPACPRLFRLPSVDGAIDGASTMILLGKPLERQQQGGQQRSRFAKDHPQILGRFGDVMALGNSSRPRTAR